MHPRTDRGNGASQLGIIPGFGGTQRLPRLVGLQKAAEMMLTSKPISEKAAKAAGLLDEVVPRDRRASPRRPKEQHSLPWLPAAL